jgi:hypothetical protein
MVLHMRKVREFVRHVVPAVLKPIRVIWNQAIALVFFALAILSGSMVYQKYQESGPSDRIIAVLLGTVFVGVMLFYGVTSFWKARKISRTGS